MNSDNNERKKRIVHEVLITLAALALLSFIARLWPVLLLLVFLIPICALRLLFLKLKTVEVIAPAAPVTSPPPETELSIIQKAFGLVQQRITEQLSLQFPGARWVWGVSNAIERFRNNEPLIILLNSAGGYNKAQVVVHNLIFKGLYYRTLETETASPDDSAEPHETDKPDDSDDTDETDATEYTPAEETPVNYGRLAFEWCDANMIDINAKYNEAIAQSKTEMLIPSDDLPHPDSWPEVCEELKRNGFSVADFCEDGIKVNITH